MLVVLCSQNNIFNDILCILKFNVLAGCPGLFYSEMFEDNIHYTFFMWSLQKSFFLHPVMDIIYSYLIQLRLIGLVGRVFANGPGELGSIWGCVIPKTLKMVLDTSLLNTQQYKVRIKGKEEQSRKRSCALGVVSIEKGTFWSPTSMVANLIQIILKQYLTHR